MPSHGVLTGYKMFFNYLMAHKGLSLLSIPLSTILLMTSTWFSLDYVPAKMLLIITGLVLVDMITGLVATRVQNEKFTSSKGLESVWKLISYALFLYIVVQFDNMPAIKESPFLRVGLTYFKLIIYTLAIVWEFYSWGENLERIYGRKPKLFTFLDSLAEILELAFFRKVKKIVSDEDEKDTKK